MIGDCDFLRTSPISAIRIQTCSCGLWDKKPTHCAMEYLADVHLKLFLEKHNFIMMYL